MKKIGVISDVHGNLQALQVALDYLNLENCEEIIHTGDVVDIGAQSLECLGLLLANNVTCLLGNHDKDFVENACRHKRFSHVSTRHKQFVFQTVQKYRDVVANFPLFVRRVCGGKTIVFEHYCRLQTPLENGYVFGNIVNNPSPTAFDEAYRHYDCDAVFFGHKHEPCDIVGKRLYVDVGSVGCHPEPLACGVLIFYDENYFHYQRFALPYDQQLTEKLMRQGDLPDGDYLFDFYFLRLPRAFPEEN